MMAAIMPAITVEMMAGSCRRRPGWDSTNK
jgi:hypothetical protein